MSLGDSIGSSLGRAIGAALSGGAWSPLSLSPLAWWQPGDFTTAFQDSAGSTPITAAGQTVGRLNDKSGNGKSAIQATPANEPLLTPGLGIRQSDTTDTIVATLTTGGTAYTNTPVGWYRSNAPAASYRLPLCDATETIITPTLTGAQEAALAAYFGTDEKYMVCVSTDTTISNLRIYTGGATTALLFVGANGATVSKDLSLNSNTSYDVSADGLTAPVTVAWPAGLIATANLYVLYLTSNALSGSLPLFAGNTAITDVAVSSNQLTGSIPSLAANASLVDFRCSDNQMTGYAGGGVSASLDIFIATNNLLTADAVDAILADFVAANRVTGARVLSLGGTGNATPSATGLTDKATLVSRGWTVTTN